MISPMPNEKKDNRFAPACVGDRADEALLAHARRAEELRKEAEQRLARQRAEAEAQRQAGNKKDR